MTTTATFTVAVSAPYTFITDPDLQKRSGFISMTDADLAALAKRDPGLALEIRLTCMRIEWPEYIAQYMNMPGIAQQNAPPPFYGLTAPGSSTAVGKYAMTGRYTSSTAVPRKKR